MEVATFGFTGDLWTFEFIPRSQFYGLSIYIAPPLLQGAYLFSFGPVREADHGAYNSKNLNVCRFENGTNIKKKQQDDTWLFGARIVFLYAYVLQSVLYHWRYQFLFIKKAMGKHDSDQFLHLALVRLKHALELSWTMVQSAGTSMMRNPGGTHGNVMGPFFRHISNT